MRVKLAFVPYFAPGNERYNGYNSTKGKVYLMLYAHPHEWVRAQDLAAATGLNKRSLFTLMRKWAGPTWHTLERQKIRGFYRYKLTKKGLSWFLRWHELMPLEKWQQEIDQWQSDQRKTKEAEALGGIWYQDEAGHWRFKSNTQ